MNKKLQLENIKEKRLHSRYNIKMDPRRVGLNTVDWIHVAQDRDQ
jgi:hypothetical protein